LWLNVEYRCGQLVRIIWDGPTSDPKFDVPTIFAGMIADDSVATMSKSKLRLAKLKGRCMKYWWGLDCDAQIECVMRCEHDFAYIVVVKAKFDRLTTRMTDIMMLLAAGIKSSRWHLVNNPCVNDRDRELGQGKFAVEWKPACFMQCLKVMMMRDALERLCGSVRLITSGKHTKSGAFTEAKNFRFCSKLKSDS